MGLTEEQIMSKPSDELILKPQAEQATPPRKRSVNYRSRPLYVAYTTDDDDDKVVHGLISCDDKDYFVAVSGRWYGGEDHNAVAVVTDCSLYEVPENDKIYVVNIFSDTGGVGGDGLNDITLAELLP